MKKVWDKFFQDRGRFYLLPHKQFNKVIERFKVYRLNKLLDLGCGSGRHSIELAKNGFSVTGVDFSQSAIDLAKKWARSEKLKINFLRANFHKKLKFQDNSFDGAIAIDSIHYDSSESMTFTLKELRRIIRPKGLLFLTLPTQIGNPLVTHLIFEKDEIKSILEPSFKVLDSFSDKRHFQCIFAIKN